MWDKLLKEFNFHTRIDEQGRWISLPGNSRTYHKETPWTAEQELFINSFLEELVQEEMYALDWQHDCFEFSPAEHIPFEYEYYDAVRKCNMYFPTYYPNGDYYLFFDKGWNYGIFGHPWKKEIIVMGKELIDRFENNLTLLELNCD